MRKKVYATFLSSILSITTFVSVFSNVYAATNMFSDAGSANIPVTCEVSSGYKVILPAVVSLGKITGKSDVNVGADFNVSVIGNIAPEKFVIVKPINYDKFSLVDSAKNRSVKASFTQEDISWESDELGNGENRVDKKANISADIKLAGKYAGDAEYIFYLSDKDETLGQAGEGIGESTGTEHAHIYKASYEWSEDMTQCRGALKCMSADCTEDIYEDAKVITETSGNSCESDVVTTYTAVFDNPKLESQTKTVTTPMEGHTYVNGTCTKCGAEKPGIVKTNLKTGTEINQTLKRLYSSSSTYNTQNKSIKAVNFVHADTLPKGSAIDNNGKTSAVYNSADGVVTVYYSADKLVANADCKYMFNQFCNLETITGAQAIDMSQVTDMSYMFYSMGDYADNVKLDLSGWNTKNVTKMTDTFFQVGSIYGKTVDINVSGWDTSNVVDMMRTFGNIQSNSMTSCVLTGLEDWDTSKVTNMQGMFQSFKGEVNGIENWDTSNVTNMSYMFMSVVPLTGVAHLDLSNWNTSKVTNLREIFEGYGMGCDLYFDITGWDTSNVTNMYSMFCSFGAKATSYSVAGIEEMDTSKVTDMTQMFYNYGTNVDYKLDLSGWNASLAKSHSMFADGTSGKIILPKF